LTPHLSRLIWHFYYLSAASGSPAPTAGTARPEAAVPCTDQRCRWHPDANFKLTPTESKL
ncbi:MAG: hypothetical protein QF636_07385, partial [Arenicellales bacterium]|nr:hypothetical protein [Arenicellales bacterium]